MSRLRAVQLLHTPACGTRRPGNHLACLENPGLARLILGAGREPRKSGRNPSLSARGTTSDVRTERSPRNVPYSAQGELATSGHPKRTPSYIYISLLRGSLPPGPCEGTSARHRGEIPSTAAVGYLCEDCCQVLAVRSKGVPQRGVLGGASGHVGNPCAPVPRAVSRRGHHLGIHTELHRRERKDRARR